jgi:hypothetical protein
MPAPTINIFKKATGLNTEIDPTRLPFDPEEGVVDLAAAVNIEIDTTGRISRRKGFQNVYGNHAHSLFCDGWSCLFVEDTSLFELKEDFSVIEVFTGLTPGKRMYYTSVGSEIYFSNGSEKGIFSCVLGTAQLWTSNDYVGPVTTRELSETPAGTHLCFYRSRIYLAQGSVVYYTEPFAYAWVDFTRNFLQLPAPLTASLPVVDGIYFSTEKGIYFYQGYTPEEMMPKRVCEKPAIDGTQVRTTLGALEGSSNDMPIWIFTTEDGIIAAAEEGKIRNLTKDRVSYPAGGKTGAGVIYKNRYLGIINP